VENALCDDQAALEAPSPVTRAVMSFSEISRALPHCVVDKKGFVHIKDHNRPGRDQVKLVLAGRLLASKLDDAVISDVTVEQLAEYTGLPKNQAAARAKECLDEKFAERSARGSYRARVNKIEEFLDLLVPASTKKAVS
jgi:hypothetical protein